MDIGYMDSLSLSGVIRFLYPVCRTYRFASFPDYLMIHLAKFTVGKDWVPMKYGQ